MCHLPISLIKHSYQRKWHSCQSTYLSYQCKWVMGTSVQMVIYLSNQSFLKAQMCTYHSCQSTCVSYQCKWVTGIAVQMVIYLSSKSFLSVQMCYLQIILANLLICLINVNGSQTLQCKWSIISLVNHSCQHSYQRKWVIYKLLLSIYLSALSG